MTLLSQSGCSLRYVIASVGFCLFGTVLAEPRHVDIENGDYAALQNTLCEAAQGKDVRTVIHLAERGFYTPARPVGNLPPRWRSCQYSGNSGNIPIGPGAGAISTQVVIKGNNATLDFEGERGLSVARGGRLKIEAVELRNSRHALSVFGRAELSRVSVVSSRPEYPVERSAVFNGGYLELRNSLIGGTRLQNVPADLVVATTALDRCPDTATAGILNEGELVANNVTLVDNQWETVELPTSPTANCVTHDLLNLPGGEAWVANSLVTSGLFASCGGTVNSRGHNSVPEGDACGFVGPGDVVAEADGVFPFVPHEAVRQLDRQMFLPRANRLLAGSAAVFGSSPSACEPLDIRGFARNERIGHCDRGAFDLGAAPAFDSGTDGLWGDRQNDGQYLQVSHYGRDRVLLTWYGFDSWGDPLWVYASAVFPGGNRVRAEAFRNTGVKLADGQLEGEVEPVFWGELRAETIDCDRLHFSFHALDPAIGTGEFELTRLTDNAAANCSE